MEIILDASFLEDKEEAHSYLQEMLDFPEYYGKNLDALYDCLTDIPELKLTILNSETASGYFDLLLPVMEEACEVELL